MAIYETYIKISAGDYPTEDVILALPGAINLYNMLGQPKMNIKEAAQSLVQLAVMVCAAERRWGSLIKVPPRQWFIVRHDHFFDSIINTCLAAWKEPALNIWAMGYRFSIQDIIDNRRFVTDSVASPDKEMTSSETLQCPNCGKNMELQSAPLTLTSEAVYICPHCPDDDEAGSSPSGASKQEAPQSSLSGFIQCKICGTSMNPDASVPYILSYFCSNSQCTEYDEMAQRAYEEHAAWRKACALFRERQKREERRKPSQEEPETPEQDEQEPLSDIIGFENVTEIIETLFAIFPDAQKIENKPDADWALKIEIVTADGRIINLPVRLGSGRYWIRIPSADSESSAPATNEGGQDNPLRDEFNRLLTEQAISYMKRNGMTDDVTGEIKSWSVIGFDMQAAINRARETLISKGFSVAAIDAEQEFCVIVARLLVDDLQIQEMQRGDSSCGETRH